MDPPAAFVDERLQGRRPGRRSSGASLGPDRSGELRRAEPLLLALDGSVLAAELTVDGDLDLLGAVDLDLLLDRLQDPIGLRLGDRRTINPPNDSELHAAREPHEDPAALDEVGQIVSGHEDDGKVAGRANREVVPNRLPGRHRRDGRNRSLGASPERGRPRGGEQEPAHRECGRQRAEDDHVEQSRRGLGKTLGDRRGRDVE